MHSALRRCSRRSTAANTPSTRLASPTGCCRWSRIWWPRIDGSDMTLERADVQRHLNRILDEEAGLLSELQRLLQDEAAILGRNDVEAIARIGSPRPPVHEGRKRLA